MGIFEQVAGTIAIAIVFIVNAMWLRAKFFVRSRGYRVGYFQRHWQDIRSLRDIINSEKPPKDRHRAKSLLRQLYIGMAMFFFIAIPLFLFVWLRMAP